MVIQNVLTGLKRSIRHAQLHQGQWHKACHQAPRPIVIAGMFNTANGIGELARTCAQTLLDGGHTPLCIDLSASLNQTDMSWNGPLVRELPEGAGTLILHLNGPETAHALRTLKLWRGSGWHIVGSWAWELDQLPRDWAAAARHLDALWTCSEFVTAAVRKLCNVPVQTVHPRVRIPDVKCDRAQFNLSEDATICLAAGDSRSSFARKNIAGAIRLFQAAADGLDDTVLVVKTRNLELYSDFSKHLGEITARDKRIIILDAALSEVAYHTLLASVDIVLSPHRAEGFGFVIAEGMAHGKAVIATGWSGNTDFMTAQTAIALPYELVPVRDPFAVYDALPEDALWAEPDLDFGAARLRELFGHPAQRKALGEAARTHILNTLDGAGYADALGPA